MVSVEVLREIIAESWVLPLRVGTPRHVGLPRLPGKAVTIVGPRRSGKTTLIAQHIASLQQAGVPRDSIVSINFFDDRLHGFSAEDFDTLLTAFFSLRPDKQSGETVHFCFDEIQEIHGWEPFVDRLLRTVDSEVTLTGSSAQLLIGDVARHMRGRSTHVQLFPFSFRERLAADAPDSLTCESPQQIRKAMAVYENYVDTGGFPEVAHLDADMRRTVLQDYFRTMILRDVADRHAIANTALVKSVGHRLAETIATRQSLNGLMRFLKTSGIAGSKELTSSVLDHYADAMVFFRVPIFAASARTRNANPQKVYCVDHALAYSVIPRVLQNRGQVLENIVFVELRRRGLDVFHYRSKSGTETDFVTVDGQGERALFQVCHSLTTPETERRELKGADDAMRELGLDRCVLVADVDKATSHTTTAGRVDVVPTWRFLLQHDTPDSEHAP